ncbi:hypothetical protein [Roseateles sp. L2-2]|uniref:hypothetical protein n=1 Tax=Roseateles sp. L2-2 TaxID=3422597 RepID=UPI003D36CECF
MRLKPKSNAYVSPDLAAEKGGHLGRMKLTKLVMERLRAFFGKAWTPEAQISAMLLFAVACAFAYTVGQDPTHFNDLQKALLALLSSGLAFFWGRMGK